MSFDKGYKGKRNFENKSAKRTNSRSAFSKSNSMNKQYKNASFSHKDEYKKHNSFNIKNASDIGKTKNAAYYDEEQCGLNKSDENSLILGRNPVIESIKAGNLIDSIYVNSEAGGSISVICKMAKEKGIVIKQVNEQKLNKMANGASHQGVIAMSACAEYVEVQDILDIAKRNNEPPFIIICDEIEDPHNLGAIIRTAEASGAHGIIIPKRRSASLNHTVYKTSAGAAAWVPVARVSNLSQAIDTLKQNGVWIYGTDAKGEDYQKVSFDGAVGLIIGSEGFGMSRLLREKCDFLLKLPMVGKITSLNASVAGGIFMYEVLKSRINQ